MNINIPYKYNFIFDYKNFKLIYIFNLNSKNNTLLNNIVNSFLKNRFGIIINVDKNFTYFPNLKILKKLIVLFEKSNIPFGIWGLSDCVIRLIFEDSLDYTLFYPNMIVSNNLFFNINQENLKSSVLLISCNNCLYSNSCLGLGLIKSNLKKWIWRLDTKIKINTKKKIFFPNKIIKKNHLSFLNHIAVSNPYLTERTTRYAKVYTKKKQLNYDNRFVYFCRYIHKSELDFEYQFLLKVVRNKYFLKILFERFYFNLIMRSFAYTKVRVGKYKFRETFYIYFRFEKDILNLIKVIDLNVLKNDFEDFKYISYDFLNNINKDFKLYSKVNNKDDFLIFLKQNFNFSFPENLINLLYNFYYIRRYDENLNLKSIKFEFNSKDNEIIKNYLENFYDLKINFENDLRIEVFAIDLDLYGKFNKLTIYYGNEFKKIIKN